jgi:hypothetical protein
MFRHLGSTEQTFVFRDWLTEYLCQHSYLSSQRMDSVIAYGSTVIKSFLYKK